MQNIGVFLSASDLAPKYTEPASRIGKLIGMRGLTMVYGGSETGLMKVVVEEVFESL